MLKDFANFVEMLQQEDKNQLQLAALSVRLFMPEIFLNEKVENKNVYYLNGVGLNDEFYREWLDFLEIIADMQDGNIQIGGSLKFERIKKEFRVIPKIEREGTLTLYGMVGGTKKINIPYGANSFFEIVKGMSSDVLIRCQNCKKIFINVTKRHMKFCSKKCRTHYSVKKLRGQV